MCRCQCSTSFLFSLNRERKYKNQIEIRCCYCYILLLPPLYIFMPIIITYFDTFLYHVYLCAAHKHTHTHQLTELCLCVCMFHVLVLSGRYLLEMFVLLRDLFHIAAYDKGFFYLFMNCLKIFFFLILIRLKVEVFSVCMVKNKNEMK